MRDFTQLCDSIEYFVCLWQIRKSWKSNIKSRKIDWLFGLVKLQISLFCLDDLFNSKNETTQPCMFWNSQQNPMIFSVKVFRLNVLQTFSRVIVGVTRRYNGGNQVIWYWPEQILCVDNESIKTKLHKHNTGAMFLMQKMGLQQQQPKQQQLRKVTEIMTMPNLVQLVNSLFISYLFSTFNSRLHIDHSLDYPSKLTTYSIYLHLLLKDILLAGKYLLLWLPTSRIWSSLSKHIEREFHNVYFWLTS